MSGYYICYEDTDSRVMPNECEDTADFETELKATKALLAYFQEMKRELAICVNRTAAKVRELQNEH